MKAADQDASRRRAGPLVLVALLLLASAAIATSWIDSTALCGLPAVVLALLMALRPYPGERVLEVLRRTRPPRRRGLQARMPAVARREIVPPRGGMLLALALAVRPPPAAVPAAA